MNLLDELRFHLNNLEEGQKAALTILFIILSGMLIAGTVMWTNPAPFAGPFAGVADSPVCRPVRGSIGCEMAATNVPYPQIPLSSDGSATFTCKAANCKVNVLSGATCGGLLPVRIVKGVVGTQTAANEADLYRLTGDQGDQFMVQVRCFDVVTYSLCTGIPIAGLLFNDQCKSWSTNPATGYINAVSDKYVLLEYQDGAKFNTPLAEDNCFISSAQANPSQTSADIGLWNTVIDKSLTIFGVQVKGLGASGSASPAKTASTGQLYLSPGTYIPYFVRWESIVGASPYLSVDKTKLCDPTTYKLYQVSTTPEGGCYYPKTELSSVECCNDAACMGKPSTPVCDITGGTYKCIAGQCTTPCTSDAVCGSIPMRDPTNGKPYYQVGTCDMFKSCCTYTNQDVQCIVAADCSPVSGKDATCNPVSHVCQYSDTVIRTPCPYACCSGLGNYYERTCGALQQCCWANSINGECKDLGTTCSVPHCTLDAECNDQNPNTIDTCTGGVCKFTNQNTCAWYQFWCNNGYSISEQLITTIFGAVILGMIGFILGSVEPGAGNIIGGIIGTLLGALLGYFGGAVLIALKPYVAVLGFIVGIVYAYDFLERIENNFVRGLLAFILGVIAAYIIYTSFVYGVVVLVIYFILKKAFEMSPAGAVKRFIK